MGEEEEKMTIMELPEKYHDAFPNYPDYINFRKQLQDLRIAGTTTHYGDKPFRQVQVSHPNRQPTLKEIFMVRDVLFDNTYEVILPLPKTDHFRWDQTRTFYLLQCLEKPQAAGEPPEVIKP